MGVGERKVGVGRGSGGGGGGGVRGETATGLGVWGGGGVEFGVEVGVGGIDTATVGVSEISFFSSSSFFGLRPALSAADCDSDVALREGRDCNCSS